MTQDRTEGQWWQTAGTSVTLSYSRTRAQAITLFQTAGAAQEDAAFIVDTHLDKALQGDHERGLSMLCKQMQAARAGELTFGAPLRILHDNGAVARVAGHPGASPKLVCRDAMSLAIRKAGVFGVGCVAAQGRAELLTPFLHQAVSQGMIAMVLAQSIPLVAPHGGTEPLLGNAPLGWGIPAATGAPVIVDMSLTQTSAKGVTAAAAAGEPIPPGFIQDRHGQPSTDPNDLMDPDWFRVGKQVATGSLLPIGASHKSYALIFVTGLLTAMLPDADFAWDLAADRAAPGTFGSVFVVIDPAAFGDRTAILSRVDAYVQRLGASNRKTSNRPILYPGERSQALQTERRARDELSVPEAHYREFAALTSKG